MRTANRQPPLFIEQETVRIIGYGHIGKRLFTLCKGLGMDVLVAARKRERSPGHTQRTSSTATDGVARIPFTEVIKRATVL
ncbi:hypothetical protein F5Y16DRAFT_402863 [Xylariaceae sp. FL0255]|nr:hypothetical protein F5Y16DRAFT_402863 [Xylariaceae sp. FL0255]